MLNGHDPKETFKRWNRGELALKEAFKRVLMNIITLYHHRKLNDRDIIRHQEEIERLNRIIPKLEDRISELEQKPVPDDSKGNGAMK